MSQPIRGKGGHLDFRIGPKNTKLVEGVEISGFREEVENVSANQRPGQRSCFYHFIMVSKNTNLVEGVVILLSVKFR